MERKWFITTGKYLKAVEWSYHDGGFEHCIISSANRNDEQNDGFNFVSCDGTSGADFEIFDTLEEAIFKSQYKVLNWDKIDISNLCDTDRERFLFFIKKAQEPTVYREIKEEYENIRFDNHTHIDEVDIEFEL